MYAIFKPVSAKEFIYSTVVYIGNQVNALIRLNLSGTEDFVFPGWLNDEKRNMVLLINCITEKKAILWRGEIRLFYRFFTVLFVSYLSFAGTSTRDYSGFNSFFQKMGKLLPVNGGMVSEKKHGTTVGKVNSVNDIFQKIPYKQEHSGIGAFSMVPLCAV